MNNKRKEEALDVSHSSSDNVPLSDVESAGTMSTLFQVMGHRPEIMQQARQLLEVTMRGEALSHASKELLAVRVSQVNHCFY